MDTVSPRPELLVSPWTEDDGVIREYSFMNEEHLETWLKKWEFENSPKNAVMKMGPLDYICICAPIARCVYYESNRDFAIQNMVEQLWRRRVAVTKDGIVYKEIRSAPVTLDPANPCAMCCCATGRYKENELGATMKVFPFDRIQDVAFEAPAGGTRQMIAACGCCPNDVGEMIPDVATRVDISTAGGTGVELQIFGLVNGQNLRKTALALKNGRDMPPLEEGMTEGSTSALEAQAKTSGDPQGGVGTSSVGAAPGAFEMVGRSGNSGQDVALLQSIDKRLGKSNALLSQLVKIGGETPEGGEGVFSSLLGGN